MYKRQDINEILGVVIKEFRQKNNISQEQMAEKSQIDRTYASALERGIKNPSLEVILKISEGIGVPAWKIIMIIEDKLDKK